MIVDFEGVRAIIIPDGEVKKIMRKSDGVVLWEMSSVINALPRYEGTLIYTGASLSPNWQNYDDTQLTIGGTTSAVNAGDYIATFTPKAGYRWFDGTTATKSVQWSIAKAAGSLSISPTSITLNFSTTSKTITVTRTGDGKISAESSNTSVATVSVNGNKVTVKSVNNTSGSATITISVAADANHTAPTNKTCSVSAKFVTYSLSYGDEEELLLSGNLVLYATLSLDSATGDITVSNSYSTTAVGLTTSKAYESYPFIWLEGLKKYAKIVTYANQSIPTTGATYYKFIIQYISVVAEQPMLT